MAGYFYELIDEFWSFLLEKSRLKTTQSIARGIEGFLGISFWFQAFRDFWKTPGHSRSPKTMFFKKFFDLLLGEVLLKIFKNSDTPGIKCLS